MIFAEAPMSLGHSHDSCGLITNILQSPYIGVLHLKWATPCVHYSGPVQWVHLISQQSIPCHFLDIRLSPATSKVIPLGVASLWTLVSVYSSARTFTMPYICVNSLPDVILVLDSALATTPVHEMHAFVIQILYISTNA